LVLRTEARRRIVKQRRPVPKREKGMVRHRRWMWQWQGSVQNAQASAPAHYTYCECQGVGTRL
jgi:hypothetical protein